MSISMKSSHTIDTNLELQANAYIKAIGEDCSICNEALTEKNYFEALLLKTSCSHIFHKSCIESWTKKSSTCPLCRSTFTYTHEVEKGKDTYEAITKIVKEHFEKEEKKAQCLSENDAELAQKLQKEFDAEYQAAVTVGKKRPRSESTKEETTGEETTGKKTCLIEGEEDLQDLDTIFARKLQKQLEDEVKAETEHQIKADLEFARLLQG